MDDLEAGRLAVLQSMHVLDTAPEEDFDELVRLAAQIAGVPTSTVSLVDADRQWFKARTGTTLCESERDIALCDHVVRDQAEMEVEDARTDRRFADNPFVTGPDELVFYSGFPLTTRDGFTVGTLCVSDSRPRVLDEDQRRSLRTLARQVTVQLELRRVAGAQAEELQRRQVVEGELLRSQRHYRLLVENSTDIISRHGPDGRTTYVSPSVRTVLGREPADVLGGRLRDALHVDDLPEVFSTVAALGPGSAATVVARFRHADGSWRHMEVTLARPLEDGGAGEVHAASRDVTERVLAARERARGEDFVRAVLDSVSVGIVACDADGRLQLFNRASREFHGVDVERELPHVLWSSYYDLFEADGRTPLRPEDVPLQRALVHGVVEGEEIVIRPHGLPARLVRCDGRALRDGDGQTVGAVLAMSDITSVRQAERSLRVAHDALSRSAQALLRSEEQFRGAFESGPMPMCRLSFDGTVVAANAAMGRLLGLDVAELLGRSLTSLTVGGDRERLGLSLATAEPGVAADYLEVRMGRPDGSTAWCEVAVTAGTDLDGSSYLLVQLADIEDRKRRELELERRVARDDLTGLANRTELHRRLSELLAAPHSGPVGVLFLDLDGFKAVNDTAGHAAGDEVLVDVARRLRALVRDEDLVARLGGDEFVLVRQDRDGRGEDRYPELVERVRNAFRTPFFTSAGEQSVGVSVGLVVASPGEQAGSVLGRADAVMYADKRRPSALQAVRA